MSQAFEEPHDSLLHEWEMDGKRTRFEIHVLVYRCRYCGCLQIKNGGPDSPGVYKPNDPLWNPFKTLATEPPCRRIAAVPRALIAGEVSLTRVLARA